MHHQSQSAPRKNGGIAENTNRKGITKNNVMYRPLGFFPSTVSPELHSPLPVVVVELVPFVRTRHPFPTEEPPRSTECKRKTPLMIIIAQHHYPPFDHIGSGGEIASLYVFAVVAITTNRVYVQNCKIKHQRFPRPIISSAVQSLAGDLPCGPL